MLYSIKLYIGITKSRYFALSISVLFILLMQLIKGAQFLNITPLFLSSVCLAAALSPSPAIVILPLTIMYASLLLQRLYFSIVVLNLIWLFVLYVSLDSPFISTHFFVQNLDGRFDALSNKVIIL